MNPVTKELRSCAGCKFSHVERMPPPEIGTVRQCRRFPPNTTTIPTQQGVMSMTSHPLVQDTQWCYEYAPSEPANG